MQSICSSVNWSVAGLCGVALVFGFSTVGLAESPKGDVVVYASLDRQFSEPILKEFEAKTGIRVRPVYDVEAVKTVGLVNRLLAERKAPRADVFWNNEIIRSIQLKKEGLTEAYVSPSSETIPTAMKDPQGHWTGFAARARVILVNKELIPLEADWPRRLEDTMETKWNGKVSYAKPLFGTTNTHAAVMWAMAGEAKAQEYWTNTFTNAVLEAGNAQTRDGVAAGTMHWCLTDTDDAWGAIVDGAPVEMIYPISDPAGPGTLLIPNTLVLIKGAPNADNGKKLIDYLLTEEVESKLAKSRSAQIPVRETVERPEGLPVLPEEQILVVDWEKAYESIKPSSEWLEKRLAER